MQPKSLELESREITYYESSGSGTPLLFVHGNSSSGRVFQKQLEGRLGQKHRVIAIDLPGHGNSDPLPGIGDYNLQRYAATVAAVATELKIESAVFGGWSLGGHILLQALEMLPNASGFVIFGTPPLAIPPLMQEAFLPNPAMASAFSAELSEENAKAFAAAGFAPDASLDITSFVADIRATDGNARAGLAASLAADSPHPGSLLDEVQVVAKLRRPLAIIHGREEQLVCGPYIDTLDIPSLWRGAVQIIANAGHTPQWEQPEKFNSLLEAFMAEVGS